MPKQPKPSKTRETTRNHVRRFLLLFLLIVASYYAATLVPWVDRTVIYPVLELSAQTSSRVINLTGERTRTNGIVIQGATFAVAVRRGCDPLEPIVLFGAAVIAFPAPWQRKIIGLATGVVVLFTLNVLRIGSLYWLGQYKSAWFETVHLELWPAFFIIFSLGLWVLWLIWTQKAPLQHA